jgi:hypothetical protein
MEVMVTPVSEQTMNNLSVQVRKGVERAFSRQRRLSSRRGPGVEIKDMPARERALPPGKAAPRSPTNVYAVNRRALWRLLCSTFMSHTPRNRAPQFRRSRSATAWPRSTRT